MKRVKFAVIALFGSLLFNSNAHAQSEKSFVLDVTNIPSKEGMIFAAIDSGKYYTMAVVTDLQMEVEFKNVPNGKHKINLFHDANNNWKLDMEGDIPLENCASIEVEITDETRKIPVKLLNVKEEIENAQNEIKK